MSSFAHSAGSARPPSAAAAPRALSVAFSNASLSLSARRYIARSPMRSPNRMKSSIIFSPASSP